MGIYKAFDTDAELIQRGIVLDFGDGEWVRISRAGNGNKRFQQRFEALMKPHRRALELGTLDDAKATEVMHQVFAETIILEWNVTGPDGEKIEFTKENAMKLFKELPDFFMEIKRNAEDRANFRRQRLEDEKGN